MSLGALHFRIPTTQASFPSFAPLPSLLLRYRPRYRYSTYELRILCILHSWSSHLSLWAAFMSDSLRLVGYIAAALSSLTLRNALFASLVPIPPIVPHCRCLRPDRCALSRRFDYEYYVFFISAPHVRPTSWPSSGGRSLHASHSLCSSPGPSPGDPAQHQTMRAVRFR